MVEQAGADVKVSDVMKALKKEINKGTMDNVKALLDILFNNGIRIKLKFLSDENYKSCSKCNRITQGADKTMLPLKCDHYYCIECLDRKSVV